MSTPQEVIIKGLAVPAIDDEPHQNLFPTRSELHKLKEDIIGTPLFSQHDEENNQRYDEKNSIGSVISAEVVEKGLDVTSKIDISTEFGMNIAIAIARGEMKGLSLGVRPTLDPNTFDVIKKHVVELSVVSNPNFEETLTNEIYCGDKKKIINIEKYKDLSQNIIEKQAKTSNQLNIMSQDTPTQQTPLQVPSIPQEQKDSIPEEPDTSSATKKLKTEVIDEEKKKEEEQFNDNVEKFKLSLDDHKVLVELYHLWENDRSEKNKQNEEIISKMKEVFKVHNREISPQQESVIREFMNSSRELEIDPTPESAKMRTLYSVLENTMAVAFSGHDNSVNNQNSKLKELQATKNQPQQSIPQQQQSQQQISQKTQQPQKPNYAAYRTNSVNTQINRSLPYAQPSFNQHDVKKSLLQQMSNTKKV